MEPDGLLAFRLIQLFEMTTTYGLTPRAFEDLSLLYEDCTGSDGTFTPSKASSSASTNQKRNCPRTIHLFLQLKPCYRMMANPKLPRLSATNADVRKPDPRYNVTNTIQTGKSAGNGRFLVRHDQECYISYHVRRRSR